MNGYPDLAVEHMEKGLFLLEQYNLLYTHDGIPQATNYAMFLTEQQAPEKGISILQKLSKGIKEYNSDCCLDYATIRETLGAIYLMTANLPQAKTGVSPLLILKKISHSCLFLLFHNIITDNKIHQTNHDICIFSQNHQNCL